MTIKTADDIRTLDDFCEFFPDAEWLEDSRGCERWSNGLGETDLESAWFNADGDMIDDDFEQELIYPDD